MNVLGHMVMIVWAPTALMIFALLRDKRRAVIYCFFTAWLFLPFAGYSFPGIPDVNKYTLTSSTVLIGIMIFDPNRLLAVRLAWYDLAMIVWCLCPFASSLTNGLGAYDGMSAVVQQMMVWGFPYAIGRAYFSDIRGLNELAIALFVAGLVYVPFALVESRLSAQLHNWVYGVPTRASYERVSLFGPLQWKPSVFMDSALAFTMFMASAALAGLWIWLIGGRRRMFGVSMGWPALAVLGGAILGKTMGALALLMVGIGTIVSLRMIRMPLAVLCLVLVSPTYMTVRTLDLWSGRDAVRFVEQNLSERRAGSLAFRMENEDLLKARALKQPVFGWGRWGRADVRDDTGFRTSTVDGLWIIALGQTGLVGLSSLYAVLLLPAMLLMVRQPKMFWTTPSCAPVAALAVILVLYSIDCLFNAMINPIYIIVAGGIVALSRVRAPAPMGRRLVRRAVPTQTAPASAPGPARGRRPQYGDVRS